MDVYDLLEQLGEMSGDEAGRWKHGIFGLMVVWELEPEELSTFIRLRGRVDEVFGRDTSPVVER